MSNDITSAFVEHYSRNVLELSQQKGSRLRPAVRVETVTGRNAYIDRVGAVAARKRTSRHADTPQLDTPHSRRRVSLPEDLRAHPTLASYTSFEGLVRSHVAAQRMVGKRIEDASPEELGRFHARHGRPESPDGYEFGAAEGEGVPSEPGALERSARDWFFEAGLSQRQAEVLFQRWGEFAETQTRDVRASDEEQRSVAEKELRSEWGRAYDRKVAAAARAVAEFGGEPLGQFLDETGLGDDPRLVRAFARIAAMVGEDSLVGAGERDFIATPEAAREEIARGLRDPAYFDANHPEHAASVNRMRTLFAAAYPEMPA